MVEPQYEMVEPNVLGVMGEPQYEMVPRGLAGAVHMRPQSKARATSPSPAVSENATLAPWTPPAGEGDESEADAEADGLPDPLDLGPDSTNYVHKRLERQSHLARARRAEAEAAGAMPSRSRGRSRRRSRRHHTWLRLYRRACDCIVGLT